MCVSVRRSSARHALIDAAAVFVRRRVGQHLGDARDVEVRVALDEQRDDAGRVRGGERVARQERVSGARGRRQHVVAGAPTTYGEAESSTSAAECAASTPGCDEGNSCPFWPRSGCAATTTIPRAIISSSNFAEQRVVGTREAQIHDVRLQVDRDLERAREREARALRGHAVVSDGPASAQRGDGDVGRDADEFRAVVHRRCDDPRDGRAVHLAAARRRARVDELRATRTRPRKSGCDASIADR